MGLDMYLTAEKHTDQPIKIGKTPGEVCGVSCLVQSWRKANQIHNWFVTHVQGGRDECQKSYVSLAQLNDLYLTCKLVLEDRSLAPSVLPTASGFFFGSTQYDDYYWEDIEATVKALEPIVSDPEMGEWAFFYQASW